MNSTEKNEVPKNLTPLLDSGWLLFMCSAGAESHLEEGEEPQLQTAIDLLEARIKEIGHAIQSEKAPIFCFGAGDNFRYSIATSKEYKPNRAPKPFHYKNLETYVKTRYAWEEIDGFEDDDVMSILSDGKTNIIVSIDKDLTNVNGWYYRPEIWNSGSFGPIFISDENSFIEPKDPDDISKGLRGIGFRHFYAQLIVGDSTDGIPGLPKHGPHAALKILEECESETECFEAVRDAYRDVCLLADEYMEEQARLLWMVRSDDAGQLIYWTPPMVGEASETD